MDMSFEKKPAKTEQDVSIDDVKTEQDKEPSKELVRLDGASEFAQHIVPAGENATELAKSVANGDIAGIWEHCEDFEKLSSATIKTVQMLNEEHIRKMAAELNANNEKMLNATFEGVKRHHERKIASIQRRYRQIAAIWTAVGVMVGIGIGWVIFALPNL